MDRNENLQTDRGRATAVCSDGRDPIRAATLHDALRAACAEVGIVDRDVPADGRWHKTDINGDPRGRGDGRIKLFADGEGGIVCNWKGETLPFFVDDGRKPTETEHRDRERRRAQAIRLAREEEARRRGEAASKAAAIWDASGPAPDDHPYLIRKRIQVHGLRLYRGPLVVDGMPCDGSLIVPACDGSGAIHTLEFIHPKTRDGDNKRFLPGGDYRGRYFSIETMEGVGPLCLCEGYATGASIHEATDYPVAVAFNAGNLGPVAQALRTRFPNSRLILCADDDAAVDGNPGLTKATEAARSVGGFRAVPALGPDRPEGLKDFNDMLVHRGREAVAECIRRQMAAGEGGPAPEEDEPRPGNGAAPGDEAVEDPDTGGSNGAAPKAEFGEDKLADQFTVLHGGNWRYVEAWGKWMLWTCSRWVAEGTRAALHLVRLVCRAAANSADTPSAAAKLASRNTVSGVESLARSDRRHAMNTDDWDRDPYLLNTLKGTVDLRTGELRGHQRLDYLTKICAASPQGECPRWEAFLDEITAGDLEYQRYLRRMAGYMSTGDTSEHALFFAWGKGGNGKSVFSVVVSTVLGDYATTAPLDTFMETKGERHPTDLAGLRGSRLVLCSETAQGRRWAESKIKALTGGDKVSARFMRQDFFEFTPQFKLLVIGNHKPGIRSVDEAIRRRLHLLPFTVTIPKAKQDKKLMEKLLLERDGILAWAVEGCLEWQLKGLAPPPCVVAATEEYFQEEDRIGQFLEEECEQGVNFKVAIADLYTRWKERAEARGEHVGTARWLVGELVDRGFDRKQMPGGAKGLAGLALKNSGPGRRPYAVA